MIIKDPIFDGRSIRLLVNGKFSIQNENDKEIEKVDSLNEALRSIINWKLANTNASLSLSDYTIYEMAVIQEVQNAMDVKKASVMPKMPAKDSVSSAVEFKTEEKLETVEVGEIQNDGNSSVTNQ